MADAVALLNKKKPPPDEAEWRGQKLDGDLVGAVLVDPTLEPPLGTYVGSWTLVCPDGQVLVTSSNPSIHHPDVVVEVLRAWYEDGRGFNEEQLLGEIERLTNERAQP